jgi:hypothetical protein
VARCAGGASASARTSAAGIGRSSSCSTRRPRATGRSLEVARRTPQLAVQRPGGRLDPDVTGSEVVAAMFNLRLGSSEDPQSCDLHSGRRCAAPAAFPCSRPTFVEHPQKRIISLTPPCWSGSPGRHLILGELTRRNDAPQARCLSRCHELLVGFRRRNHPWGWLVLVDLHGSGSWCSGHPLALVGLAGPTGIDCWRSTRLDLVGGHYPQLTDGGVPGTADHVGDSVGDVLGGEDFGRLVEGVDLFADRPTVV